MAWNINFNGDYKIIKLTYSGLVPPAELRDAFRAAVSLSKTEETKKFLADCTDMFGGHSVADLYFLIVLYESNNLRGMREALLLPSLTSSKEEVEFYETACLNRGFLVKIFDNMQDALSWLTT